MCVLWGKQAFRGLRHQLHGAPTTRQHTKHTPLPFPYQKQTTKHAQNNQTKKHTNKTKITYASDYFDKLHSYALQLIAAGKAYVCHQSKAEIEASREVGAPSPWRERSVEENLRLFGDMRRGLYAEGAATLRMKMDHRNENPNMWDSVAYRYE